MVKVVHVPDSVQRYCSNDELSGWEGGIQWSPSEPPPVHKRRKRKSCKTVTTLSLPPRPQSNCPDIGVPIDVTDTF